MIPPWDIATGDQKVRRHVFGAGIITGNEKDSEGLAELYGEKADKIKCSLLG